MIEYLYKNTQNVEEKTLDSVVIHKVLEILENGSMNEFVRENLSEKKKIKDLFLVVINSINIEENRKLVSSLIQFVSNLCYGTGKFRVMLRSENPSAFFGILRKILQSVENEESEK